MLEKSKGMAWKPNQIEVAQNRRNNFLPLKYTGSTDFVLVVQSKKVFPGDKLNLKLKVI